MIKQRMCGGCMNHFPKENLLRIVRTPSGEVVIDKTHKSPGRGAYICKEERCLNIVIKKKWLWRALKTDITPDIYEQIKTYINSGE
jgi:predicted RNA-binding protein YlxR (DUF448 family)